MKLYSKLARPIGILALGLVLVGGSFALAPRAYAVTDVFPCTIETEDGTIYPGTWINGVCQPNNPIPNSTSITIVIKPISFFDRLHLWFTLNAEKKAGLLQNFSNRNFELAKQKLESGDTEKAQNLFLQANDALRKASQAISHIVDEGKKTEATNTLSAIISNRTTALTAAQVKVENPIAKDAIQQALDKQSEMNVSVGAGVKNVNSVPSSPSVTAKPATGAPIAKCLPTSTPSVTILSPNGGETYTAGQQITVKWKTCNLLSTDQVAIGLLRQGANGFSFVNNGDGRVYGLQNDGVETFTLPSNESAGLVYKIDVDVTRTGAQWDREDTSDNLITIN